MQCPRCSAENDNAARFCEDCGARLEATCPGCGQPTTPGKKFCRSCGAAITAEPARRTSPETYTPKHLAEKILASKGALEGERKQITVLFADLKGSMELLADRDPEEARKLLDPVLERMMDAVHRYEGTVNQVMGDGIMALFGAPLAHEDHAVRACYAALRMQESVKKYADEVRRSHAAVVKIRVGLNSGEVVVRAIGSDLPMDYTAVGQTTHLAARMEQLADPGAIVIRPDTLALAEGYVEVKSLGPVPVKGLADAVEVYEVTGAGPARTRLQAAARRGLTRFVGRYAELEQLRRAQQLAGDRRHLPVPVAEALVPGPRVRASSLLGLLDPSHSAALRSRHVHRGRACRGSSVTDRLPFCQLQDLAHGAANPRHQGGRQASQWPSDEAAIIDGPKLVDEQIGRLPQPSGSRDPDAKGLGVGDQARGEGNDQGGRVAGVEQRLRLDDEDGSGLAWLSSPTGIEAGQPHLTPTKHPGPARWQRTRR